MTDKTTKVSTHKKTHAPKSRRSIGGHDIIDLYDLLLEQLRDLYDGEQQQLKAFAKLDRIAHSFELTETVTFHRKETMQQLERLNTLFEGLDEDPGGESCDGIKGLIKEMMKLSGRCKNNDVRDAGLITALQHINHYEMAGYGTAVAYAKQLDHHDVAQLLLESLREEKASDIELSKIAQNHINPHARWSAIAGQDVPAGGRTQKK